MHILITWKCQYNRNSNVKNKWHQSDEEYVIEPIIVLKVFEQLIKIFRPKKYLKIYGIYGKNQERVTLVKQYQ